MITVIIDEIDREVGLARFVPRCGQFVLVGRDLLPEDAQEAAFHRTRGDITIAIQFPRPVGDIGHQLRAVLNPGLLYKYAQDERGMIKTTLLHEIGHQVHAYIDTWGIMKSDEKPIFDPIYQEWRRCYGVGNHITEWAATAGGTEDQGKRQNEYFAETFAARYLYPTTLGARDPDGYALIDLAVAAF